jgi:hypothetical protein
MQLATRALTGACVLGAGLLATKTYSERRARAERAAADALPLTPRVASDRELARILAAYATQLPRGEVERLASMLDVYAEATQSGAAGHWLAHRFATTIERHCDHLAERGGRLDPTLQLLRDDVVAALDAMLHNALLS